MAEERKLRIGLIGAGGRGGGGYVRYFDQSPVPAEVAAVADPSESNVRECLERLPSQSAKPAVYADWRDMLRAESRFDGMIIATPNFVHREPALACMDKGVGAIALEKPLAHTPEACGEIVAKAHALGVPVQLGFVFRSAPFFVKVKQLVDSGVVGRIATVQADELVSTTTTSVNFRGPWRRRAALSGGTLLEKCCHDMDLLNWIVGSRPQTVSSFGGVAIFRPNGYLPDVCDSNCKLSDTCRYFVGRESLKSKLGKMDRVCVFNAGADVADHQAVQIQYEDGVVCSFVLNFNADGDGAGRHLHIVGTRGRIWGREGGKSVMSHDLASGEVTEHPLELDGSGHAGGNRRHAEEFLRLAAGLSAKPVATAYDAYLSAMVCFAADRSRIERRQVGFRYPRNTAIEIC